jgi:hypothetical protein
MFGNLLMSHFGFCIELCFYLVSVSKPSSLLRKKRIGLEFDCDVWQSARANLDSAFSCIFLYSLCPNQVAMNILKVALHASEQRGEGDEGDVCFASIVQLISRWF